jgi:hypothetical protein
MTAPPDTAEAQRVRIWIPIEHASSCRVTVSIADSSGNSIRHMLEQTLATGYYNLYWDKQDDSGVYVEPGTYTAIIDDLCADERREELEVIYSPGEMSGRIIAPGRRIPDSLRFEILVDSARVSCEVLNRRDRVQARVLGDSLFLKGTHSYTWPEEFAISPGLYTARVTIDGYTRLCPIRFIRRR